VRVDVRRAARAGVLAVWTAFFVYLWATGEMSRYLGPRTYWVVVFGAITLGLVTVVNVMTLRARGRTQRLSLGEAAGLALLLVPVVAVSAIPGAGLGALAASRKSTGAGVASVASLAAPSADGEVSFLEIHYASESEEYAANAGIADGYEVELVGFVSEEGGGGDDELELSRFYVSCCAADAIPYSVPVDTDKDYPLDTWLEVSGTLSRRGDVFVLVPESIAEVEEPKNPYLY
jgi:putative membrane protein